jgi:hypothetical protein
VFFGVDLLFLFFFELELVELDLTIRQLANSKLLQYACIQLINDASADGVPVIRLVDYLLNIGFHRIYKRSVVALG